MLCFWFAIHNECLQEAKHIYDLDPIIGEIMQQIRVKGEDLLQEKRAEEEAKRNGGVRRNMSNEVGNQSMVNQSGEIADGTVNEKSAEEDEKKNFENL